MPINRDNQHHQAISDVFGENTFSLYSLKEHVSETTYNEISGVILKQQKMDTNTAHEIAQVLIKWAMAKGVTHYTHWFHPLTESSAEKHDAFFKPTINLEARGIESLSASELVQREPDGSSFPSGGLRTTHAARSYTIWDPSSPAFIMETENGKTLYVPAVFISYTGESLDYKTPLLKANHALNIAATAVCHYFDQEVTHVFSTLGCEQEYFLVDEKFFNARPDLLLSGRTIIGGKPAKGQQMDDHYFGSIPERVQNFMKDFELESLKLGIPIVTRHNEVAPGQYEAAPMFEEMNVAVDHNLLIMDVMQKIAIRHRLRILFSEKPFAGLNGSGKHNNWSIATGQGKNLLSPGNNPGSNLQFLTFFVNVVKAIHDNGDLLRASIASAGNDHRLGANEAPPAIISVFIGSLLEKVLSTFKTQGLNAEPVEEDEVIDLHLSKILAIKKDQTDRNRTSPFPFVDNRFEFRAVGASANCAAPMTVLNTIVADQLEAFKKEVDSRSEDSSNREDSIVAVLQGYMEDVDRIVFNGDGYSAAWETEAASRGLPNNKTTPDAIKALISDRSKEVFGRQRVFNERELESRYEVQLENYINTIAIEADLLQEMSRTYVLPAANESINNLGETYRNLNNMGLKDQAESFVAQVRPLTDLTIELHNSLSRLKETKDAADRLGGASEVAKAYADRVKPHFDEIRASIDKLEVQVDNKIWQLPKYRELLFIR
ncbi:MAG: glutamine synthetase [Rhodothermales bacterium]|jgi:glutamine synthetase